MTAPARFRQSDLLRAHKATQDAGVSEYRLIIDPITGKLEIIVGKVANDDKDPVELD